jgi:hypothetical protein
VTGPEWRWDTWVVPLVGGQPRLLLPNAAALQWLQDGRVTLNLGLRWDHFGVTAENYGAQANFVPGPPFGGAQYIVAADRARSGQLPLSQAFLDVLAQDGIALVQSSSNALGRSPNTDFAPRLGIAYLLADRLVVPGGYGIFHGGFENIGGDNLGGNYPFLYTFNFPMPDRRIRLRMPTDPLRHWSAASSACRSARCR